MQNNEERLPGRKFIEDTFPIREVSEESIKEKDVRRGHIAALHLWWARRPLASSRSTAYAALVSPKDTGQGLEKRRKFIIELSKWDNSTNLNVLDKARADIRDAYNGDTPSVLDPFAGGGAIPLEALRLGCKTYSCDYNPVSVLIQKCTLEYPQKYQQNKEEKNDEGISIRSNDKSNSKLFRDIEKWSKWVFDEVVKETSRFYSTDKDGAISVGYIWARTIPCQNPKCNAEIPLMRQYWLTRKDDKKIALYPYVSERKVKFRIVGTGHSDIPKGFDPNNGTISRAVATCLVCGSVVDSKTTVQLFKIGKSRHKMVAIVLQKPGEPGKRYRIATDHDIQIFRDAEIRLDKKREYLAGQWGIDPVPDEPTPEGKGKGAERAFSLRIYNMNSWGDLFNSRQKISLITFAEKIRNAFEIMIKNGIDKDYATTICTYLALILDKVILFCNMNCSWKVDTTQVVNTLVNRHVLQMTWDYFEVNPISGLSTSWPNATDVMLNSLKVTNQLPLPAIISQASATNLPFTNDYFDAILTDPPYYDNVPYSYLSDFFYVWLKRSIGHLHPDLFSTPLTPKSAEIVAYSNIYGGWEAGKKFFEDMLSKAFKEIYRILKPEGISVIVYAHKSTAGWETLINSLLDSGLVVTAAWPIKTEMRARLRAKESAALASSIYIVSRKIEKKQTGFFREVKDELKNHLERKLDKLEPIRKVVQVS